MPRVRVPTGADVNDSVRLVFSYRGAPTPPDRPMQYVAWLEGIVPARAAPDGTWGTWARIVAQGSETDGFGFAESAEEALAQVCLAHGILRSGVRVLEVAYGSRPVTA